MRKLLDGFYLACVFLSGTSLVLMVVLVLLQILARFFNTYIPSSDDISGYMVAWTTFLGTAYVMRKNDHIRVDVLFSITSPAMSLVFNTIANVLGVLVISVLLYYVYLLVKEAYDYGDVTAGFIPFPLWIIQLPYLLGVFALWVAVLDRLVTTFRKPDEGIGHKSQSIDQW